MYRHQDTSTLPLPLPLPFTGCSSLVALARLMEIGAAAVVGEGSVAAAVFLRVGRRRSLFGTPPALPYSPLFLPYLAATPSNICSDRSRNSCSALLMSRERSSNVERVLL